MNVTFKQFLLEASSPRTAPISNEDAIELINEHCTAWATTFGKAKEGIWRAGGKENQALYGDSTKGEERKSANTNNYFTLWHDNAPEWADYPKRGRSFVCSTSVDYAHNYGAPHLVVPYDAAKVAAFDEEDLFNTFPGVDPTGEGADLSHFNDTLTSAFERVGLEHPRTYEALVKNLKALTKEKTLEGEMQFDTEEDYLNDLFSKTKAQSYYDIFKAVFDPRHSTIVKPGGKSIGARSLGVEVYVQGKAIMLSAEALHDENGPFKELIDKYGWNFIND